MPPRAGSFQLDTEGNTPFGTNNIVHSSLKGWTLAAVTGRVSDSGAVLRVQVRYGVSTLSDRQR